MTLRRTLLLSFVFMVVFSCTKGGTPNIQVDEAKFMQSPMLVGGGSAFMVIRNSGKGDDTLTGCAVKEYPEVHGMLHDFEDGKMKMVHEFEVPAEGAVELKKGEKHLMFSGLPEQLGDSVTIILNFRKSGPVEIMTKVDVPQDAGH